MATTIKKAPPKPLPLSKPVQLTAPAKVPKEYGASGEELADPEPVIGKQAVGTVNKKYKDGSETDEQIQVGDVKQFKGAPATVGLSMAVTRNLGNYESVKMMVSLYLPCDNNEQAIADAFDEAKGWVDTRVELLNQEVNEQLG